MHMIGQRKIRRMTSGALRISEEPIAVFHMRRQP